HGRCRAARGAHRGQGRSRSGRTRQPGRIRGRRRDRGPDRRAIPARRDRRRLLVPGGRAPARQGRRRWQRVYRYAMTDSTTITAWMNGYLRAWDSNDPADIAALFTDDGEYLTAPYATPRRGVDAIVAGWIEDEDQPGDYTF